MQAVGRIGGYISKSVDTVAAPFHPFGGAVDVIVVLQPDGTYKSNPWYVRFGKFQGVFKTKEKKMITIVVNGVEAGFHMYLNHRGEAYFLTEINGESDGDHAMDLLDWTANLDSPKHKKNVTDEPNETFVSCTSFFAEAEEDVSTSGECVMEQVVNRILTKNRKSGILEEGPLLFSDLDEADDDDPYDECCTGFSLDNSSSINSRIADANPHCSLKAVSSEPCLKETDEPEVVLEIFNDILEEARENQSPSANIEKVADKCDGTPSRSIKSLHERRRSWPFSFQRSNCIKGYREETNGVDNAYAIDKDLTEAKEIKKIFRKTLTPTSKQLASLNLKEGKNIIVFAFQTAVLGKQQVDARIFMWRWDTRIVISDVDGTITRSDLLGQVMPLVGMDWSQMGVAHLFSAIKENGYQILFLSARSIAQSVTTRQFLLSVKQDGVALPDGPIVISPDGLFPSLFREVVRRAPHEFKIACLEDIKALFPTGTNPFCGGFGNRDTDEISYLKVGIPRKKVFIINPKGEISVNRRVETKKAYVSLHALVHDMFPSVSYPEEEEWKFHKTHD